MQLQNSYLRWSMPKNKGKGGKNRRRGKNENEGLKRELIFKEDGQEYAQVQAHQLYMATGMRIRNFFSSDPAQLKKNLIRILLRVYT